MSYKTILESPDIDYSPSIEDFYNHIKSSTKYVGSLEEFQADFLKDDKIIYESWAMTKIEEKWMSFFKELEELLSKTRMKEALLEVLNGGESGSRHGYSKVFKLDLKNLMKKIKNSDELKLEIKKSSREITIIRYNKDRERGTVFILRPKSFLKQITSKLKALERVSKV